MALQYNPFDSAQRPGLTIDGTLLDSVTINTTGTWQGLYRVRPWSVTARGTFGGATVTIYISDQLVKPLDTDILQAPFQIFTAPGSGSSQAAYRWIKAAVTGAGGGTLITVDLMGG